VLDFALAHWRTEPETRVADAYKWLFHATLGGEHAIRSEEGPRRWMDREWEEIGPPRPGEPDLVPLRPDGAIVRINLRPYKAGGGDKEALLMRFIASARSFRGDRADFTAAWLALGELLRNGPIGALNRPEWEELDQKAEEAGYPAVHHSPEYEAAYEPAYRVVTGETHGSQSG
jgi:hypothetical protein